MTQPVGVVGRAPEGVGPEGRAPDGRGPEGRRAGAARSRLLGVALDLYAVHGVEATTLQMIADELGVTKAAVYHQFHAKDDIVRALVEPVIEDLAAVATAAEAQRSRAAQMDTTVSGLIDVVVRNRRLVALLHADPAVHGLIAEHPAMLSAVERIGLLMHGPDPDPEARVVAAMLGGALMMPGNDPNLSDIDDDDLRRHLLSTARRMLKLRQPRTS